MKTSLGAMVQNGANEGAIHPWCNGAKPYIGVAPLLHQSPPNEVQDPTDPLARPDVIRIALSESASNRLLEAGTCFAIVSRQSWPADPKRVAIYLLPLDLEAARAAESVALGRARAVRIKASPVTGEPWRRGTANPDAIGGVSGGDTPVKESLATLKSPSD